MNFSLFSFNFLGSSLFSFLFSLVSGIYKYGVIIVGGERWGKAPPLSVVITGRTVLVLHWYQYHASRIKKDVGLKEERR
jgi:hypothetical protein